VVAGVSALRRAYFEQALVQDEGREGVGVRTGKERSEKKTKRGEGSWKFKSRRSAAQCKPFRWLIDSTAFFPKQLWIHQVHSKGNRRSGCRNKAVVDDLS